MLTESKDPEAPSKVLKQEEESLKELVELTRGLTSSSRHAETLGALIVLGVHSKDVTSELLSNGIRDRQEFEWINQLRHYLLHEPL
jgi:dynein heavy chain